ncbi:MAG: DUF4397 domain-containing protein [Sporichthyaceae bacterium]|nr:DUF4397 domain-containing protein [Sporichthyaceae bacterium]
MRKSYWRLAIAALAALPVALLIPATNAPAATSGWVRLAHLSPDTPSVDVYLYDFGDPDARIVLEHVGYGALSPYQRLDPGRYTVAMRLEGADPKSPAVISKNVEVAAGEAFTVAGFGRTESLKIEILTDSLNTRPGMATLRVIQASLQSPEVDVSTDDGSIASGLRFPGFTPYESVTPGSTEVTVTGASDEASLQIDFKPASIHTLVVLDNAAGDLRLLDLFDASGTTQTPIGGVATGLGGTAPASSGAQGASIPAGMLWLGAVLLAAVLAVGPVTVAKRGAHRRPAR